MHCLNELKSGSERYTIPFDTAKYAPVYHKFRKNLEKFDKHPKYKHQILQLRKELFIHAR